MKISEIKIENVKEYLRIDDDFEDNHIINSMAAAKAYIIGETGLAEEQIDEHEDLYIAYMALVQDMYDNRAMQIDKNTPNMTVDSILARHRINLI